MESNPWNWWVGNYVFPWECADHFEEDECYYEEEYYEENGEEECET